MTQVSFDFGLNHYLKDSHLRLAFSYLQYGRYDLMSGELVSGNFFVQTESDS